MMLSKTHLGPFTLYAIETGRFRLDGGAMFGVVPKTLWSRQIEADEKNRIPMAMRCLLIESANTGRRYLVDTGIGTKFGEKMEKIYEVDHNHSNLEDSLAQHGFGPDDITDVIFSHLHFDHCGGTTRWAERQGGGETGGGPGNGEGDGPGDGPDEAQGGDPKTPEIIFHEAQFHVTAKHWETANNPNAREKASFFEENLAPLEASGRLNLVEEGHEYEEGLTAIPVHGHTISQQLPRITVDAGGNAVTPATHKTELPAGAPEGGTTLVFMADLIPTHVHVPLPWIMGYDMHPVQTLGEKENFLEAAAAQSWHLFLEHDAQEEVVTVRKRKGKYEVDKKLRLSDL